MSTYADFLNVVDSLSSGEKIDVSIEWCTAHGLTVDRGLVDGWGQKFAKEYRKNKCKLLGKTSDNSKHYEKK